MLIEVKAAGVNPVDTYVRSGSYTSKVLPHLPYTPGADAAGLVVDVGDDVSEFKVCPHTSCCIFKCSYFAVGEHPLRSRFLVVYHQIPKKRQIESQPQFDSHIRTIRF